MFKLPEAAQRLGVSIDTARRYVRNGDLPSVFIGGAYRISQDDLDAFIESRRGAHPKANARSGRADKHAEGYILALGSLAAELENATPTESMGRVVLGMSRVLNTELEDGLLSEISTDMLGALDVAIDKFYASASDFVERGRVAEELSDTFEKLGEQLAHA